MLQGYFEKFGHKCRLKLDSPFDSYVQNKNCLVKWFIRKSVISPNHILLRSHPRSYATLRSEILYQLDNYPYVLHPLSVIAFYVDIIWMLTVSIWFITKPMSIFKHIIPYHHPRNNNQENAQVVVSFICLLDCVRRFFTGIIIKHCDSEEIVLTRKEIALHYLKFFFFFDFVSSLPAFIEIVVQPKFHFTLELISYIRVIRLRSLVRVTANVMRLNKISHNVIDVCNSITILFIIIHWIACFSVLLGIIERQFDPNAYEWYDNVLPPQWSIFSKYVTCLHRSVSILTGTGYSFYLKDTKSENDMLYTIFTAVLGHLLTITIFAKLYEIVNGVRSASAKYEEMLCEIMNYMKHHNLSETTQKKIETYYAFKYDYSYFNEQELLGTLPISLRQTILLHGAKLLLDNIEFFRKLPTSLIANIVSHLAKEIVLAGDVIIRSGDGGTSMYFLLSGTVATYTHSGREITHLGDGSEFGECVLSEIENKRTITVLAIETVELFKLHSNDFLSLIDYCPDLVDQMEKMANQRREIAEIIEERYLEHYKINVALDEKENDESGFGRYPSFF